jgi:hypothetical protein
MSNRETDFSSQTLNMFRRLQRRLSCEPKKPDTLKVRNRQEQQKYFLRLLFRYSEIERGEVNLIDLDQDRVQWQVCLMMAISIRKV